MNSLIDISGTLDAGLIDCIECVHVVCSTMGLDVLLVGAVARDIHFLHSYGIRPGRATMDVDVAVLMPDWDTFGRMKARLLEKPGYKPDRYQQQRLHASEGRLADSHRDRPSLVSDLRQNHRDLRSTAGIRLKYHCPPENLDALLHPLQSHSALARILRPVLL